MSTDDKDAGELTPKEMYPTMDSLSSVVDLGISQLPIESNNALLSLIMTYHNTLLSRLKRNKKE